FPTDSEGKARARLMEDFRDNFFNPPFVEIIHEVRKPEGQKDPKIIEHSKAQIVGCFDRIEKELAGKEYLAGTFSIADIAFMANFDSLERFQIPVDPKYQRVLAWMERLKARPSFAASAN
ncbi:MAG: glutathione S-transferase family protein, partial [Candidatus Binatia bacterium]